MNKATLQPDGTWKVETMTDAEEADWKETQESGKTLKANILDQKFGLLRMDQLLKEIEKME